MKNRIHSLVKEQLYGFTQEELFDRKSRGRLRELSEDPVLKFQLNHMLNASLKLRKWYDRLSEHKKAGLARTGLRRKVLAEIYQMLKKGECHYDRDVKNHEGKMAQYHKFLEKKGGNLQKTAVNTQ